MRSLCAVGKGVHDPDEECLERQLGWQLGKCSAGAKLTCRRFEWHEAIRSVVTWTPCVTLRLGGFEWRVAGAGVESSSSVLGVVFAHAHASPTSDHCRWPKQDGPLKGDIARDIYKQTRRANDLGASPAPRSRTQSSSCDAVLELKFRGAAPTTAVSREVRPATQTKPFRVTSPG